MLEELVARLAGERLEVADTRRIGCRDPDPLSRRHVVERLFCAQDGKRAIEATRVDFTVDRLHRTGLFRWKRQIIAIATRGTARTGPFVAGCQRLIRATRSVVERA